MKRRVLLASMAGAALSSQVARAQQPARLAWIAPGSARSESGHLQELKSGLTANGVIEGRDYVLDVYYAEGDYRKFPDLLQAALSRAPAILLAVTVDSVRVAQQATKTVPIVFFGTNDPVGAQLVNSLARPGGHTTGIATLSEDTASKLLEMMQTVLPAARRLAVLVNPLNVTNRQMAGSLRTTGTRLGLEVQLVEIGNPGDVDGCFGPRTAPQPEAAVVLSDGMLNLLTPRIAVLGIERRIAILSPFGEQTHAGGLLSYGPSLDEIIGRVGFYVKRILAGSQPRDMPIEQPTRFELVVNMKTAKALGLTIPPSILARADEVIE
jgi:putative ABC transport system substrate-binding protein